MRFQPSCVLYALSPMLAACSSNGASQACRRTAGDRYRLATDTASAERNRDLD